MHTKRTILSEKESNLIEEIVAKFGLIVTFDQILRLFKKKITRQAVRNLANKLVQNGWLVRIKKGTYAIATLESRGIISTPMFKIAQVLAPNSYISFEAALQNYGMFDQMLRTITSMSLTQHKASEIEGTIYQYVKTQRRLFFGWEEVRIENYLVKIATPEKAILDLLTFKRNISSIDMTFEKLKEFSREFDYNRLFQFSEKHPLVVQRIIGFLLDKCNADTTLLFNHIKYNKSCSFMNETCKRFNAKWRLYYHESFA